MFVPLELTGLTQRVPHPDRPLRGRQGRERADSRRHVRDHPGPLGLRQVHGAVDRRRARQGDLRRRDHRRPRGDGPWCGAGDRLSVAVPAAVADRARQRDGGGHPGRNAEEQEGGAGAGAVLSRHRRHRRLRHADARRAVARHAAVRVAGARAGRRTALPAARRALLAARLAHPVRAAGPAPARVGGVGQDGDHGHPRHRRGALPRRPPRAHDRRARSDRGRRLYRPVCPSPEPRRRAGPPALPRGAPSRDRLPRAPRPPVAPERARRRAREDASPDTWLAAAGRLRRRSRRREGSAREAGHPLA